MIEFSDNVGKSSVIKPGTGVFCIEDVVDAIEKTAYRYASKEVKWRKFLIGDGIVGIVMARKRDR
jgi:hypothetical protein